MGGGKDDPVINVESNISYRLNFFYILANKEDLHLLTMNATWFLMVIHYY